MIRTVIFDIDNTLYDFASANETAICALERYAEEQFGWPRGKLREEYKAAQDELLRAAGFYHGGVRDRILRIQLILEKYALPFQPHAAAMYRLYWDTLLDVMVRSEGAEEVLRSLKERGVRIGAGTDMTAFMQFQKLERLGLLPYFDFIVTSEEAGQEKPSAVFFSRCKDKMLCAPEECLFVGDHPEKDYRGAKRAGLQALWYNPQKIKNTNCPDEVSDLREILDRVDVR